MDHYTPKPIIQAHTSELLPYLISRNASFKSALEQTYYYIQRTNATTSNASLSKVNSLQPRFNDCTQDKLEQIYAEMSGFKKTMPELDSEPRKTIRAGDAFQPMEKILKLSGGEDKVCLENKEGEVLLVVFWMTEYIFLNVLFHF